MAYLPELHYCSVCKVYLGMDDGDGICAECDNSFCVNCEKIITEENPEDHKCWSKTLNRERND